jgi:hypothetical protein
MPMFSYINIDDPKVQGSLISEPPVEVSIIKRNLYNSLSQEAKEVISLILLAPSDFLDSVQSPIKHSISKARVATYLRKKWKRRHKVTETMQELEKFVENISTL